jgi:hypothetical protein
MATLREREAKRWDGADLKTEKSEAPRTPAWAGSRDSKLYAAKQAKRRMLARSAPEDLPVGRS